MPWPIFSFLSAFFQSLDDVFGKKSLKKIDEYIVAWGGVLFAIPFLIPVFILTGIPEIGGKYWIALAAGGSLNIIALILYMRAIKSSDLSITVPMVAFTPLFLLVTSPIMLGEFPSFFGILGVILIVFGAYILNINKAQQGFFAPFKALLKEKGPRLMLLVAFIWSITSNFDKVGSLNSSPFFWTLSIHLFIAVGMIPLLLITSRRKIKGVKENYKTLLPMGFAGAISSVFNMVAISLTFVAYAISIKRTSTIMTVFFGHTLFNEKGFKERLAGTIIMVLGVISITLLK
ncbi:MAG: EamA family transporter [archaeon]|jgi:drug/metabolite transporter (DMT)-like permease